MVIEDWTRPDKKGGMAATGSDTDSGIHGGGDSGGAAGEGGCGVASADGGQACERGARLAAPMDRLAAVVADIVVLFPLILLTTAPFRRTWERARLLQDTEALPEALLAVLIFGVLTAVLYQTLFVFMWGATPGKRVLGIRIVTITDGGKPLAMQALLRSLVWCFETALLMIPWLAALSHQRRRPWHDRIADTEVVALDTERAVGSPQPREVSLVAMIQSSILACVSGFLLVMLQQLGGQRESSLDVGVGWGTSRFLCSAVTEASDEWLSPVDEAPSRVEVALALFGAGAISERCLESEADYALWNGKAKEKPNAYLAKSLALGEESDDSLSYYRKACDSDAGGPSCRLASLFMENRDGAPDFPANGAVTGVRVPAAAIKTERPVLEDMLTGLGEKSPSYLYIYAISELTDNGRYGEALRLLERTSPHRRLGYFYASHRAQALWGLYRRDEARLSFRAALEGLNNSQRTYLARWFCDAEIAEGCSAEARLSCGVLDKSVERSPSELEDPDIALTWIRSRECSEKAALDYQRVKNRVPGAEAQTLLSALLKLQQNDREGARMGLQGLVSETDADNPYWYEAQARLAGIAVNEKEISPIIELWSKEDSSGSDWARVGYQLMRKLESMGSLARILAVGKRLLEVDPFNVSLRRRLMIHAYRAGDIKLAGHLFERLRASTTESRREPADLEFEKISRALSNRESGS